ncbi:VOC family protein [Peribacillus sp. SCS-155]|uniref:VOC family protein n=1 Tax=Peribacillus sedimenti TaxID=3115297 RepID=UPI0039061233
MTLKLTPYLVLDGNAKEAIQFYEKALDAQVLFMQTFGEMPENPEFPLSADVKGRVAHALLKVVGSELMFSDTFPGSPYQTGNHVTLSISTDDADKARQIFEALQQGGKVNMPLQKTFFSPAYGNLTDKYGVTFQIHTEEK